MPFSVEVQMALDNDVAKVIPDIEQLKLWATSVIDSVGNDKEKSAQMTVRIVNQEEITRLNSEYRHKDYATNVLSFPFANPPGIPEEESVNSLGDLVICASVVNREAEEQHKSMTAHWAHMVVHGTLHLLGYDHQDDEEAKAMESMEKNVLKGLGFDDPYK